jgi:hypothetical protein
LVDDAGGVCSVKKRVVEGRSASSPPPSPAKSAYCSSVSLSPLIRLYREQPSISCSRGFSNRQVARARAAGWRLGSRFACKTGSGRRPRMLRFSIIRWMRGRARVQEPAAEGTAWTAPMGLRRMLRRRRGGSVHSAWKSRGKGPVRNARDVAPTMPCDLALTWNGTGAPPWRGGAFVARFSCTAASVWPKLQAWHVLVSTIGWVWRLGMLRG